MTADEKQLSDDWRDYNDLYRRAQKLCQSGNKPQRKKGQQIFASLPTLRDALKKRAERIKAAKSNGTGSGFSAWWESQPDGWRRTRRHRKLFASDVVECNKKHQTLRTNA